MNPALTYEEALAYITSRERFGSKLGLEQIGKLLARLGDPQKAMQYVHVAGTNGKGSTTSMIAGALCAAGYRTGMYISPSVESFAERIQINMEPISDDALAAAVTEVKAAAEQMEADGDGVVTEFEVVMAAAFLAYKEAGCEIAVLETGLGGRLDATNIIDRPRVAVIVSVSFDHIGVLGDTLTQITREKCGIIKDGCPVVSYVEQQDEVLTVLRDHCAAVGSQLVIPAIERFAVTELGLDGTKFVYDGEEYFTRMTGAHFAKNALSAIEALRLLAAQGLEISPEAIKTGVAGKPMTARMEKINDKPCILLDGAHNPDGVAKLCETIDTLLAGKRIITVMGMFADKDYEKCIPEIARHSDVFIATTPPSPRALPAKETFALANGKAKLTCIAQNPRMAFITARRFAKDDDVILCCGSLSFLGGCKKTLEFVNRAIARYGII